MDFKLSSLFIIIVITSSVINADNNEHGDNVTEYDYELDSYDGCSEDEIIDFWADVIIPEDYEEAKNNIKTDINSFNELLVARNHFQQYSQNVSQKMSEFTKRFSSRMTEVLMTIDLPTDCMSSLARIMTAAKNGELWALKFFDAVPRPLNGMLELSGAPMANYDQCLSIESPPEVDKPTIYGHFCGIDLWPYLITDPKQYPPGVFMNKGVDQDLFVMKLVRNVFSNSLAAQDRRTHEDWLTIVDFWDGAFYKSTKTLQFCMPSTCAPRDVSKALTQISYPLLRIPLTMSDDCDYAGKPLQFKIHHIIAIVGLSSVFAIFVLCSVIDSLPKTSIITKSVEKTSLEFYIKCFSVKRNIDSVFGLKQYGKFKALDGFRAILTFFIVLLHNYEIGSIPFASKNHYLSAAYGLTQDYRNMFLPNILLMDNFLLVSAFLLGNTMLSKLDKSKGSFNYVNYLVYRYLRLIPVIICGLLMTYLFEFIGDGALWTYVKTFFILPCYDKWHKPLLMYNNLPYYPNENNTVLNTINCFPITWYSSCDFQLYALAPIVFLLLYKCPKLGFTWNIILLIGAVLLPLFNRFVLNIPHVYELFTHPNMREMMLGWGVTYWGPVNYFQTYIIGILVAYSVRQKPNIYLGGRIGELFIWIITFLMSFSLLYWQRNFIISNYRFQALDGYELHAYIVVHKLAYLSLYAWLIFACTTGRGGILNEILGWKGFKVIDNLTLEIYLMHSFAFVYRVGVKRDQVTITDYYVWTSTLFDFLATYIVSVIVALVVTRPFANMTATLLKPPQKKDKELDEELNGSKKNRDWSQ